MKKLMIALAAVTMGVVANAATYNWNVSTTDGKPLVGPSSSTAVSAGTLYMFVYDAANCTQAKIWESIRSGDMTIADWAATSYAGSKTAAISNGAVVPDSGETTARISTGGSADANNKQKTFTVVTAGDLIFFDDEASKYVNETDQGAAYKINQNWAGDTEYDFTKAGKDQAWKETGWYSTAAIPEPTSGLLLLLGVAGLALRRRRA